MHKIQTQAFTVVFTNAARGKTKLINLVAFVGVNMRAAIVNPEETLSVLLCQTDCHRIMLLARRLLASIEKRVIQQIFDQ